MPDKLREWMEKGVLLGDGGYLLELERRGYVDSGSRREKVGTGRGSGQYTPEVAIEHPEALRGLHQEFLRAGSRVLQALTFYGTREKLTRAGYGAQTEEINAAAVRIAREAAAGRALVAGTISRTQLFESEGPSAGPHVRELFSEQVRLLQAAGVDFFMLETFFSLEEMRIALECVRERGLPIVATMSFRPDPTKSTDGRTAAECARVMEAEGAQVVGANCEQDPERMLGVLRAMRPAVSVPLAAQPSAFLGTGEIPCFTKRPQFPDELETIQAPRKSFYEFARMAAREGIGYLGGCCGANAAYIRALADGLEEAREGGSRGQTR